MSTVQAKLWVSPMGWPELESPEVSAREPIGLCFSGGGARSLAASWGQLRALYALGALDRARYISGVSGGSWASGIYTFQRVTDEATFLGPLLPPEALTLTALAEPLTPQSLGFAATRNVWGFLAESTRDPQVPPDRLWADVIGRHMLAPYGLFDHGAPEAVAPNDAYVDALRALAQIRPLKDDPPELALVDDAPEGLTAQLSLTLYDLSAPRFVRLIVRLIDPARRHLRLDGPSVRASEPLRVRLASAAERGAVGAARLLTADGVSVVELGLGVIGPVTEGDHGVKLSASLSRLTAELPQHHIDDPLSPELPVPEASAGLRLSHQRKWAVAAEDLSAHRAELARMRSKNLSYGYTVPE